MNGSQHASAPWRVTDAVTWCALVAGAGVLLLAAWWGASGTAVVHHQVVWLNVGAVSVMLVGTANVLWLLSGRRALGERKRGLLDRVDARFGTHRAAVLEAACQPVTAAMMTRYHRPGCQFAAARGGLKAADRDAHERQGLRPCVVCRP